MDNIDVEVDKPIGCLSDSEKVTDLLKRVEHLEEFIDQFLLNTIDKRVDNHYRKCKIERGLVTPKESLDTLYSGLEMRRSRGTDFITYEQAAEILGVSVARVCQLKSDILADERLYLSSHPFDKRRKIITLRRKC